MPHNRTRIWVGIGIVAITIPAVGEFYSRSTAPDLLGSPISRNARLPLNTTRPVAFEITQTASNARLRDYAAELDAKLARQGPQVPVAGGEDDPTFDVSPYDEGYDTDPSMEADTRSIPTALDPVAALAPTIQDASSEPSDAPAPNPETTNVSDAVDRTAVDGLSDSAVYGIVVNNLPADQRDEFSRAFAAMSQDQRSRLLDNFRSQMQGGNGQ